jgi:sterol desaturase/sphingolipid hydroxylase (fatty acid hydroxylase superfamily)
MSISLGVISRFPYLLNLGLATYVYSLASQNYNINIWYLDGRVAWITAFIFYDFLYYWSHRAHHRINILWAAHSVHHHGEEFNLSTALRQTSSGFLITWIFFIPAFILGTPPSVFASVAAFNLVYQFWVHTEHIPKLGWLESVLVTPSHHRVHHAQNEQYIDSNYGGVFIFWDRIFGTFVEENAKTKVVYGTVIPLGSWSPVWANFSGYFFIAMGMIRAARFREKVWVLFCPPAWCDATRSEKHSVNKHSGMHLPKFNPPMDSFHKVELWIQLVFVMLISASIAYELDYIGAIERFILCGCIVYSTFVSSLAAINKRTAFLIANATRVGFMVGLCLFLSPDLFVTQICAVFSGISIITMSIWLVLLRFSSAGISKYL